MPYIPQAARGCTGLKEIKDIAPTTAGELQWCIAVLIKNMGPANYQEMNDVMGALAGAQMEFYRRHVAPYEDKKIEENGDV